MSLSEVLSLPLHKQAAYADHATAESLNDNFAMWNAQTLGNVAYLILYDQNITTRLRAQRLKQDFINWYYKSSWCTLL